MIDKNMCISALNSEKSALSTHVASAQSQKFTKISKN